MNLKISALIFSLAFGLGIFTHRQYVANSSTFGRKTESVASTDTSVKRVERITKFRPDGTKDSVVEVTKTDKVVNKNTKKKQEVAVPVNKPLTPKWRIGAETSLGALRDERSKLEAVSVGRRLGDSNAHATLRIDREKNVSVGVSIDF